MRMNLIRTSRLKMAKNLALMLIQIKDKLEAWKKCLQYYPKEKNCRNLGKKLLVIYQSIRSVYLQGFSFLKQVYNKKNITGIKTIIFY